MRGRRERGLTERGKLRHRRRLPAAERRDAIVDAALGVFAAGSYAGATTADIARAAQVSEPILYRHFGSKRELYLACVDEAWRRLQAAIAARAEELGPAVGLAQLFAVAELRGLREQLSNLWIQALAESGDDPVIRDHLRRHLRQVHDGLADRMREAQATGIVPVDRDVDAEAWITLAGALLLTVAGRLGGLLGPPELAAISTARRAWLVPDAAPVRPDDLVTS